MAGVTRNPRPLFVTTLPSAPSDGQEIYYQSTTAGTGGGATDTMATVGSVWHLRYRSASASAYKWEFVGGATTAHTDLSKKPASLTAYSQNVWTDIDNAVVVKAPLAGDYLATYSIQIYTSGFAGLKVGSTDSTLDATTTYSGTTWGTHSTSRVVTAAALDGVSVRYQPTSNVSSQRLGAMVSLTPIRVG